MGQELPHSSRIPAPIEHPSPHLKAHIEEMAGPHGQIWKKRILLPLWIAQLIALVIFLGLTALALWAWNTVEDDVKDDHPALADAADSAIEYVNMTAWSGHERVVC